MAHYATLADYRFSDEVRDIRGAHIYGADESKIGKVDDVLFDHANGDIQGLVVDIGKRDVLLSPARLFRYPTDENDFQTDLTRAQVERLPAFDVKHLHDDQSWKEFERRQEEAIRQQHKQREQEYKREFHDDPVEHRRGSDRLVTPEADEMPAAGGTPYRVTAGDLTPERLAGKFPDTGTTSAKLQMRPAGTPARAEDQAHSGPQSPNWTGFQNTIRSNLRQFKINCPRCKAA